MLCVTYLAKILHVVVCIAFHFALEKGMLWLWLHLQRGGRGGGGEGKGRGATKLQFISSGNKGGNGRRIRITRITPSILRLASRRETFGRK
jgi:hypothetical protein